MASDGDTAAEAQGKLVVVAVDGSEQANEALDCKFNGSRSMTVSESSDSVTVRHSVGVVPRCQRSCLTKLAAYLVYVDTCVVVVYRNMLFTTVPGYPVPYVIINDQLTTVHKNLTIIELAMYTYVCITCVR